MFIILWNSQDWGFFIIIRVWGIKQAYHQTIELAELMERSQDKKKKGKKWVKWLLKITWWPSPLFKFQPTKEKQRIYIVSCPGIWLILTF